MIRGYFEGLRPYVECDLHIPRFDIHARIPLLFDTGADGTCLHQKTASELRIPFHLLRDPKTSRGIGREEPTYFREPATLSFDDGGVTRMYVIELNIGDPSSTNSELPSVLGRDVFDRWTTLYDPSGDRLEFTVRDADFTIEGSLF